MSSGAEHAVETLLASAGCTVGASYGAISPPVHFATTFERDADLAYRSSGGYCYARIANPTRSLFERAVAAAERPPSSASDPARDGLEVDAAAFASGMAAVCSVFQAMPSGHVLLSDDVYHGVRSGLQTAFGAWGLGYTEVDMSDDGAVRRAVLRAYADRLKGCADLDSASRALQHFTLLLWLETPTNPCCKVVDIRNVSDIAGGITCDDVLRAMAGGDLRAAAASGASSASGAAALQPLLQPLVVVDATWCTPCLVRPLACGADLVVHSATKYLGGHSDLTGGVVVGWRKASTTGGTSAHSGGGGGGGGGDAAAPTMVAGAVGTERADTVEIFRRVRQLQTACGAVMAPFDCWLCLRGMRSLGARMRAHCTNAMAAASMLASHPAVSHVYYPGLPSHAGHAIAAAQMNGRYGGMLSVRVHGGRAAAVHFAARLRIFRRATSLGGTESLVEHRRSIEPADSQTPDDLLRMSIGIEEEHDILDDLRQALDSLNLLEPVRAGAGPGAGAGEASARKGAKGASAAHMSITGSTPGRAVRRTPSGMIMQI